MKKYEDIIDQIKLVTEKIRMVDPELTRWDIDREASFLKIHARFSDTPYIPKHSPFLDDAWQELVDLIECRPAS